MTTWRINSFGEAALLIEATPADDHANRAVQALARALDDRSLPGVGRSVPAINTLLVPFDPLCMVHAELETILRDVIDQTAPLPDQPNRILDVPVTYGGEHGPDLLDVAQRVGLSPAEVVALHAGAIFRARLIGFAPGFPYLGPLPDPLRLPRRRTPRTAVPAGSVAIAADMTGIYPARLPGGWHLIGHTLLPMFDPRADPPTLLQPGDGVRFVPQPDGIVP